MRRRIFTEMFRDVFNTTEESGRTIDSKIPHFDDLMEFSTLRNIGTPYILLNPHKCNACWKCIEQCPKEVIGKINLLVHKHVKIKNARACIGCLKCVKACEFDAIYKINRNHRAHCDQ